MPACILNLAFCIPKGAPAWRIVAPALLAVLAAGGTVLAQEQPKADPPKPDPLKADASKADEVALAKAAVAAIAAREGKSASGRLSLTLTERRTAYRMVESLEALRKRVTEDKELRPLVAQGLFHFAPQGWVKELSVPSNRAGAPPSRTRTGELNGTFRMLVEASAEGEVRRAGRLLPSTLTAPADAILGRRVARSLKDLDWATAKAEGETLKLVGFRTGERHALTVLHDAAKPEATRVKRWEITRTLTSPTGERMEQTYACEVAAETGEGADLAASRLEEWVINPPPAANVAYRVTDVKPTEGAVILEDLAVRFPKGTMVTDLRTGDPVEYELTEDGTTDADLAEATAALTKGRAKAGQPAPLFELKDLKGGNVRLTDFKDKALLVFWFSTGSPRAEDTGKFFKELYDDYRKRGVEFLALNIGEEGDAKARAESFRKNAKWNFPVALDSESDVMRRYGAEAGVPKVAVVDRTGKLLYVRAGIDAEAIVEALEKVAQERKK